MIEFVFEVFAFLILLGVSTVCLGVFGLLFVMLFGGIDIEAPKD